MSERFSVEDVTRPYKQWRLIKNILAISVSYCLIFTSFDAISNLQSSVNTFIGIYSMLAVFGPCIISSLTLTTLLLDKLSAKWSLFWSMFSYSTYIAAQLYPSSFTLIPTAILIGLSSAPMWSAKCTYLTEVSKLYAKETSKNEEEVLSHVFSVFFFFFNVSRILGNWIASAVLSSSVRILTTAGDTCGAQFCPKHLDNFTTIEPTNLKDGSMISVLCFILLAISLTAPLLIGTLVDHDSKLGSTEKKKHISVKDHLIATLLHMRCLDQFLLIPITTFMGMYNGFLISDLTAGYVTCSLGIHMVGYKMMYLGISTSLSTLCVSGLVKIFGQVVVICGAYIVNLSLFVSLLLWEPSSPIWILYVVIGVWGLVTAIWETQLTALYSIQFQDNIATGFSSFHLWKSIGYLIAFSMSSTLCISVKIYILIGTLTIGIIGYLVVVFRNKSKPMNTNNNDLVIAF